MINYSIIGPANNEADNLIEYVDRINKGFEKTKYTYEILILNDGSTDHTDEILDKLKQKNNLNLKIYFHRKNRGLSSALNNLLKIAKGQRIIWIPTDLEAHPDEDIPKYIEAFENGAEVVCGNRINREDGKKFASLIYNFFINKIFRSEFKDMNWSKGFIRECINKINLKYDNHRFIIPCLYYYGFKIKEINLNWYNRKYGSSKFNKKRFFTSFLDLIGFWFHLKFINKPFRFFGSISLIIFFVAISIQFFLVLYFLIYQSQIRPLFNTSLIMQIFSILFFALGLIGELILNKNQSQDKDDFYEY